MAQELIYTSCGDYLIPDIRLQMKIKYCFIQDFIDGQAPYLYKHIFSQSELSELLHGSIKSDTESFVSVIVASV